MNKLLYTILILLSTFVFSQYSEIDSITTTKTLNSDLVFDGLWTIEEDNRIHNFKIKGDRIINNQTYSSKPLILELHFTPNNNVINLENFDPKDGINTKLGRIEGNGSSLTNIQLKFKSKQITYLKNNEYRAIVLLKDEKTKEILNYKVLNNLLNYSKSGFEITQKSKEIQIDSILEENKDILFSNGNIYKVIESEFNKPSNNTNLNFVGKWNLEMDFKTLDIKINGQDNGIENHNSSTTNPMRIMLYFSKNKNAEPINGFELTYLDIKPLKALSKFNNLSFKTNITKMIPRGTYYPILILSEINEQGKYISKSMITLGESYTF